MNIWTIKEGEPLPISNSAGRIMRCGIISYMLAQRGHNVTWWTSTYSHQLKKYLRDEDSLERIEDNYHIRLLHSKTVYKRNISLHRFIYSKQLGDIFAREARQYEKPDIIFCAYPLVDLAYEAVRYGKETGVPVIVDIRDFWPDIFVQPFPEFLHPIIRTVFFALRKRVEYVIQNADMLTSVVPYGLEWAVRKGRKLRPDDKTVYLGYDKKIYSEETLSEAEDYWCQLKITKDDIIACYFGNIISRVVDFNAVLYSASRLRNIKFVICGSGEYLETLKKMSVNIPNLIITGYISQEKIQTLMNIADFGLLPYYNTEDLTNAVPNKAIEYLAGGLTIVSSLQGLLKNILIKNGAGVTYTNKEELVSILSELILNKQNLEQIKYNAEELFNKSFTADRVYGELCNEIERVGEKYSD